MVPSAFAVSYLTLYYISISGSDVASEWTSYQTAWHPTEDLVVTGHEDGNVRLWDLDGDVIEDTLLGTTSQLFSQTVVRAVSFNADGSLILSVNAEGKVRVWNTATGQFVAQQDVAGGITGADWNNAGSLVIARGGATVNTKVAPSPPPTPNSRPTSKCLWFANSRVHFTLVQNMLVMVPGEIWGFKGRIFGAGTM